MGWQWCVHVINEAQAVTFRMGGGLAGGAGRRDNDDTKGLGPLDSSPSPPNS